MAGNGLIKVSAWKRLGKRLRRSLPQSVKKVGVQECFLYLHFFDTVTGCPWATRLLDGTKPVSGAPLSFFLWVNQLGKE
jgi:hypothetical protein